MQLDFNKQTGAVILRHVVFWSLFGLFNTFSSYVYFIGADYKFDWPMHLLERMPSYLLWVLFCPVIYAIVQKLPFQKPFAKKILLLAAAGILISVAQRCGGYLITYALAVMFGVVKVNLSQIISREIYYLISAFFDSFMIYCGIVIYTYSRKYYSDSMEKELLTARLQADLNGIKLQALQAQLQPHFLFNTLHTISSLIWSDQERADRALSLLSQMLRRIMDLKDQNLITLKEEIELESLYLAIQQTRFEDKVEIQISVQQADHYAMVPALLLQPLLENIFKHSVELNAGKTIIRVSAASSAGRLVMRISENGGGFKADELYLTKGTGLSNLRERLNTIARGDFMLNTDTTEDGLFSIIISLPLTGSTIQ